VSPGPFVKRTKKQLFVAYDDREACNVCRMMSGMNEPTPLAVYLIKRRCFHHKLVSADSALR
jgi:hypothetical protein